MHDIVIVGGGIMGAAVAYHAARAGASVALVDAEHPGRATAAGAGIVSDHGLGDDDADPAWTSLVTRSTREHRRLFAELGDEAARASAFAEVGEVVVAADDAELAALDRFAARLAADPSAPDRTRLTAAELRGLWPVCTGDVVGLHLAGTARVDGRGLAAVLRERAIAAGARFVAGEATPRPDRPTSVEVDGETVAGGRLVLAAGTWAPAFAAALGVAVPVVADRGQIVHLAGEHPVDRAPVLKTFAGPYLLGFGDGRVVAGATHGEPDDTEPLPRAGDQLEVLEHAFRVAPGLRSARIRETRIGFRPRSIDGFPLVGPLGATPPDAASDDARGDGGRLRGVWLAGGLGAWGLTMAPLLGRLLVERLLHGTTDEGLALLDPHRTAPPGRR